jgi:prepilin-type N-terminal cleavage/methylation domain-containing protein
MHFCNQHQIRIFLSGSEGKRPSRPARRNAGFTLIEIMIVVAIIAVVMATSIPMIWKAMSKNELSRAVNDVMEGCKAARDRAILSGKPYEFIVHNRGDLIVAPMPAPPSGGEMGGAAPDKSVPFQPTGSLMPAFPRKLGEDVIVQLIDVNFVDHMDMPEARVRFFPNGTSDEFTIVLMVKGIQRTVTLDIITALPEELQK